MRLPTGRGAPSRVSRRSRHRCLVAGLAAVAGVACELPPGIDTVDPGEGEPPPVGVAEVDRPPDDEGWVTDFLAWQPGGEMACRPAPGPPGTEPLPDAGEPEPVVVEIWDGLVDACTGRPESGNRSIRLSLSDRIAGTFTVSTVCSGPLSAGAVYRTFPGAQERRRVAVDGTVTVTGIAPDDVIEGAFSVLFEGDAIFTSGTFRAAPGCVSAGR